MTAQESSPEHVLPIETERLRLRPFDVVDLETMYEIYSDEGVVRWLYEGVRTRDEVRELLSRKQTNLGVAGDGDELSVAVERRETGELVGDVSLACRSVEHRQAEIGFVMHPAHHGRGYAGEAARPLLDLAFSTFGFHRVIGRLEPRNGGSARVLEKLGMRREAHLVENEWIKGEWQSELVYAVLAREWAGVSEHGVAPEGSSDPA
jgi:RimJ/RimL family protein N-acetyltransferase